MITKYWKNNTEGKLKDLITKAPLVWKKVESPVSSD